MAIDTGRMPSVMTVKYTDAQGFLKLVDIQAAGTTEAKDIFDRDYPGCTVVNIFRKQ